MRTLALLFLSTLASAQVERPVLGMMLDQTGALRPVIGVPGSATLGDPVLTGVLSSACSARLCLAKIDSAIISLPDGGTVPAPPGQAIFALNGDQAYVYFPESNWAALWHNGILDRLDFIPDFFKDGAIHSIPDAVIFPSDRGLRILRDDGTETDLDLPGITGIQALGENYVEVVTTDALFLLQVDANTPRLFLLPGTAK